MTDEMAQRVRAIVAAIPAGEVLSYGEVAALAGLSSARQVGRILAGSNDLPWHRVIRANGKPTPHLAAKQTALLRAEGVRLVNGRVAK
jgi:methylated-DNA-protein-cysteine methyltransferase-like protein